DPRKGVFLTDRDQHIITWQGHVTLAGPQQRAPALSITLRPHLLEEHPGEAIVLVGKGFRHHAIEGRKAPRIASPFYHREAFISSKPERTTRGTSVPPSRREERQQSIAVLPPPSTITRLPMELI